MVTGIGVGLTVVALGFIADVWVDATIVVNSVDVGLMDKVGLMG